MSFLTPKHLQDAARILRGLALVAARAAADSSLVRRGAQGDYSAAAQEALIAASRQGRQVAEQLERAAADAGLSQQLQQARDAAQGVSAEVSRQVQGAVDGGGQAIGRSAAGAQQAFTEAVNNPQEAVNQALREGQIIFQQAATTLQDTFNQAQRQTEQTAPAAAHAARQAADQASDISQQAASQAQAAARRNMDDVSAIGQGPHTSLTFTVQKGVGVLSSAQTQGSALQAAAASVRQAVSQPDGQPQAPPLPAESAQSSQPTPRPADSPKESLRAEAPRAAAAAGHKNAETNDIARELQAAQPEATPEAEASEQAAQELPAAAAQASGAGIILQPADAAHSTEAVQPLPEAVQSTGSAPRESQAAIREKVEAELDAKAHAIAQEQIVQEVGEHAPSEHVEQRKSEVKRKLRERSVPSSSFGRAFGFAQLGVGLVYGSATDYVSSYFRSSDENRKSGGFMTQGNAERLADALCRMRGAALKLGQMLSIQDENMLPPQLSAALERVRAGADIMPQRQLEKVMSAELGDNWRSKLASFDQEPLAAASIGQVHGATLHDGRRVAVKIQYPGVARSIESDVDNLMRIISLANLLPKGLYVDSAAKVAKRELALECNYMHEAQCQQRFKVLVAAEPSLSRHVNVPDVIPSLSSHSVLTTEFVPGAHIDKVAEMSQEHRDHVGSLLLRITLLELFRWRFMQTDPNWGNFMFDASHNMLHLIDFGAATEYPKQFVDDYVQMVRGCALKDRREVLERSTRLGFLTGDESKVMLDAHTDAGFVVGEPFGQVGVYDFGESTNLTRRVTSLGSVMMQHRLTPPPQESYSLHRKLSGAFLACMKLRSRVPCRDMFFEIYDQYVADREADTSSSDEQVA